MHQKEVDYEPPVLEAHDIMTLVTKRRSFNRQLGRACEAVILTCPETGPQIPGGAGIALLEVFGYTSDVPWGTAGYVQRASLMLCTLYPKMGLLRKQCPPEVFGVYEQVDIATCQLFSRLRKLLWEAEARALPQQAGQTFIYLGVQQ